MGRQNLKLRWSRPALSDLIEAQEFISKDSPAAGRMVAQRLWDACEKLPGNPEIGRSGHVPGTREWVASKTPYLVVYRVTEHAMEILRIWHSKQDWQHHKD